MMRLYSVGDVASALGVTRQEVFDLIEDDLLPKSLGVTSEGYIWVAADIDLWALTRNAEASKSVTRYTQATKDTVEAAYLDRIMGLRERHGPWCIECGKSWHEPSPDCPHRINDVHPLTRLPQDFYLAYAERVQSLICQKPPT